MDDLTLAQKLLGKEKTKADRSEAENETGSSIFYMVAVTSSQNGEVVLKDEIDSSADWEEGDYIEVEEDGEYEEYESEDDDMEDIDDGVIDMTDGDGVDIEEDEAETTAFTVSEYQAVSRAAYAANDVEPEASEDPLPDGSETVTTEIDDGDAEDLPDVGEDTEDPIASDTAGITDLTDDAYDLVDDNEDDESDDIEGAEESDGYTIAETIGAVNEGDRVAVMIQDGKVIVLGVVGSGDERKAEAEMNEQAAEEALDAAEAAQAIADEAAESASQANTLAEAAQSSADQAKASADAAKTAADNAQSAVDAVEADVASLETSVDNAQKAADNAQAAAVTAKTAADNAQQSAENAAAEAETAKTNAAAAQTKAEEAAGSAASAQETAADAVTKANAAQTTADAARSEVAQANEEIEGLSTSLETTKQTLEADYSKKTDLSTVQANLQAQITENAAQIEITHTKVVEVDETANDAKEKAEAASTAAGKAQTDATAAKTAAANAQTAADNAKTAADNAQSEADAAKTAATNAKSVADKAQSDLEAAQADLATVSGRVDATEEDIAAAQEAVTTAQAAADKAKQDAAAAQTKAETAQSAADDAATKATAAQTKADAAKTAADDAALAASNAQTDATAAKTAAANAQEAAETAQTTANTAKTNAAAAQTKADQAATDAAAAQTTADAAKTKAETAQSDLTKAKENLEAVKSRVDATEEDIAAAEQAVQTAQSKADEAAASAAAAQSTADTAKADAATAQTAADKAKADAAKAQTAADNAKAAAEAAQADVNSLKTRVTKTETDIKKNADAIELTATKEEVTETLGGYYTKEEADAAIEVKADSITQEVSNTYATKQGLADANTQIETNKSQIEQTAKQLKLLIKSGDTESSLVLTDKLIELAAAGINLKGLVSFSGLNSDAQSKITSAQETATSAKDAANSANEKVDNMEIGGRNLFLNTGVEVTNNDYNIAIYVPAREPLVAGETYTVSLCVTPAAGVTDFDLCFSDGNAPPSIALYVNGTEKQILTGTFTPCYGAGRTPDDLVDYSYARFYRFPGSGVAEASTVHWVKIEKGNVATDWTPAPEDAMDDVDVEYYLSTSSTSLSGGSWSTTAPAWVDGKYMWSRTVKTDGAGNKTYSPSETGVCIAGAKGATGPQGYSVVASVTRNNRDDEWWNSYCAVGHTEIWSDTSNNRNGCRIGDLFTVTGTSTTGKAYTATFKSTTDSGNLTGTSISLTYSEKGDKGDTGATGPQGEKGDTGATGPQGEKGDTGATGLQGDPGKDGTNGKDGTDGKSVKSVTRYYKLATTKPSTPSTSWSTTEPAFDETGDTTSTLYFADLTTLSDNSTSWSAISVSSSYEAAKKAYEKASAAATKLASWCAENEQTLIDGAKIYTGSITAEKIAAKAVTAEKISIDDLKALQAKIGGFTIGDTNLRNGTTSLAGADNSVYLGLDGISCGKTFKVDKAGNLNAASGKIGGFTIGTNHIANDATSLSELGADAIYIGLDGIATSQTLEITDLSDGSKSYTKYIVDLALGQLSSSLYERSAGESAYSLLSKVSLDDGYLHIANAEDEDSEECAVLHLSLNQLSYKSGQDPGGAYFNMSANNGFMFKSPILFAEGDSVGTTDYPSGNHTLKNNTSVGFVNSAGTRARGIALGSTDNLLFGKGDSGLTNSMYFYVGAQDTFAVYGGSNTDVRFRSFKSGDSMYIQAPDIYNRTTSSGSNVRVNSNGTLYRYSSSSMRYKQDITTKLSDELDPERLYDLKVWQYKYREGHLDKNDQRYGQDIIGFIAEDVKQKYPIAVNYNEDGQIENWNVEMIVPAMLKLIQDQKKEIDELKERLN